MKLVLEIEGDRRSGYKVRGWDDEGRAIDTEGQTYEEARVDAEEFFNEVVRGYGIKRGEQPA